MGDRKKLQRRLKETFRQVSEVLWKDWDPIGLNETECPDDEYDDFVWPIVRILLGSRDEAEICEALRRAETDGLGYEDNRKALQHRREVVRKLLAL